MLGHTDRKTINARRPLTANMVEVLRSLKFHSERKGHGALFRGEMTQAEKNAARALMDREMVGWDVGLQAYYIKGDGLAALAVSNGERQ